MATSLAFDNSHPVDLVSERLLVLEDLLELAERAQNHTHSTGSAVVIRDGDALVVRTSTGVILEVGATLKCGQGLIGNCATKPYCGSPAPEQLDAQLVPLRVRSLIAVPVRDKGEFLGALIVTSQSADAFNRIHTAILMSMAIEAVRVIRRLQALNGSVPLPNATKPVINPEPPAPLTQPQDANGTIAQAEAAARLRMPTPVSAPAPKPEPKVAAVPLTIDTPSAPDPKPAPGLLCAGEDPGTFGRRVTPPVERQTFTTGVVQYKATRSRIDWSRIIYAAAVIAVAGAAITFWPRLRPMLASAPPLPAERSISAEAAVIPVSVPEQPAVTPVSTSERLPVKTNATPAPVVVNAAVAEPAPRHREDAVPSAKPAAPAQPEPAMAIAPGSAHQALPAHVDAPSVTGLGLAASLGTPDLPAPKIDKPLLSVASSVVVPAALLHSVAPVYPEAARSAHIGGDVHMQLTISDSGNVTDVKIANGSMLLRQAAMTAVRQWKYRPATVGGRPVSSTVNVIVKFWQ